MAEKKVKLPPGGAIAAAWGALMALGEDGMAPFYGMMASVPDRGMVRDFVLQFLDGLYEV